MFHPQQGVALQQRKGRFGMAKKKSVFSGSDAVDWLNKNLKVLLFCFVLFCFVLFCFVLFCFVLFCFVLFCFVLFCFVLFCFVFFFFFPC
jgi:hypothetical protein